MHLYVFPRAQPEGIHINARAVQINRTPSSHGTAGLYQSACPSNCSLPLACSQSACPSNCHLPLAYRWYFLATAAMVRPSPIHNQCFLATPALAAIIPPNPPWFLSNELISEAIKYMHGQFSNKESHGW